MTPSAQKLYDLMEFDTSYVKSELGVMVFGKYRKDTESVGYTTLIHRTPQGSARAVGRCVTELENLGLISYREDYRYLSDHRYYFKNHKPKTRSDHNDDPVQT